MSGKSSVTEDQCDARQQTIVTRLNSIDLRLARIEGKLSNTKWLVTTGIALAAVIISIFS